MTYFKCSSSSDCWRRLLTLTATILKRTLLHCGYSQLIEVRKSGASFWINFQKVIAKTLSTSRGWGVLLKSKMVTYTRFWMTIHFWLDFLRASYRCERWISSRSIKLPKEPFGYQITPEFTKEKSKVLLQWNSHFLEQWSAFFCMSRHSGTVSQYKIPWKSSLTLVL